LRVCPSDAPRPNSGIVAVPTRPKPPKEWDEPEPVPVKPKPKAEPKSDTVVTFKRDRTEWNAYMRRWRARKKQEIEDLRRKADEKP
jgi:hypothetical protein